MQSEAGSPTAGVIDGAQLAQNHRSGVCSSQGACYEARES